MDEVSASRGASSMGAGAAAVRERVEVRRRRMVGRRILIMEFWRLEG
jgi:hypothetical protein